MISRGTRLIAPRGGTRLRPNDHLFIIAGADSRAALERALSDAGGTSAGVTDA
jgi:hypothetical protein